MTQTITDLEHLKNYLSVEEGIEFDMDQISGPSREAEFVFIRAIISYYLQKTKGYTLERIGDVIGRRGHATIINLLKYDSKSQARDPRYKQIINRIDTGLQTDNLFARLRFHQKEVIRLQGLINKL